MSTLNFTEIINEVQTSCPTVYNFLSRLMQLDVNTAKKLPSMTLIYAIIMFTRCKELSRVQRLNAVLLTEGDASQEVHCLVIRIICLMFMLLSCVLSTVGGTKMPETLYTGSSPTHPLECSPPLALVSRS